VRASQYYGNYRWLITDPDMASLRNNPAFPKFCSMNCTPDGSATSLSWVLPFQPSHPNYPRRKLSSRGISISQKLMP
jgi:hypothetical protein